MILKLLILLINSVYLNHHDSNEEFIPNVKAKFGRTKIVNIGTIGR